MVHLHFKSKDALIAEAAQDASDAYYAHLEAHLSSAPYDPVGVISAVVGCDLSAKVMNPRTVGIWYELRGSARTSPAIAAHSDTRGGRPDEALMSAFLALAEPTCNVPDALARDAMRGTIALLEGIWNDFMLHPNGYDVAATQRFVCRFLHGLFPDQFAFGTQKART